MSLIIEKLAMGLHLVSGASHADSRGSFARWFCDGELAAILGDRSIRQINHSATNQRGSVRGMHFQMGVAAEMKFVRCIKGRVFDVAVNLDKSCNDYLRWHAVELSAEQGQMLCIPEHFAHGFQTLEDDSELLYVHSKNYQPEYESALRYNDPQVGISWPEVITQVSDRLDKIASCN